jgi:hypothetical protein
MGKKGFARKGGGAKRPAGRPRRPTAVPKRPRSVRKPSTAGPKRPARPTRKVTPAGRAKRPAAKAPRPVAKAPRPVAKAPRPVAKAPRPAPKALSRVKRPVVKGTVRPGVKVSAAQRQALRKQRRDNRRSYLAAAGVAGAPAVPHSRRRRPGSTCMTTWRTRTRSWPFCRAR